MERLVSAPRNLGTAIPTLWSARRRRLLERFFRQLQRQQAGSGQPAPSGMHAGRPHCAGSSQRLLETLWGMACGRRVVAGYSPKCEHYPPAYRPGRTSREGIVSQSHTRLHACAAARGRPSAAPAAEARFAPKGVAGPALTPLLPGGLHGQESFTAPATSASGKDILVPRSFAGPRLSPKRGPLWFPGPRVALAGAGIAQPRTLRIRKSFRGGRFS